MLAAAAKSISIVPPEGGETLDVLGAPMIVKADDGAAFVADHLVPPGYFVPPHTHDHDDEAFFILEGELTLLDGYGDTKAGPGTMIKFERGVVHGFRNDTDRVVRFLVLCTPGVQAAEMFRHFDRAGRTAPLTPEAVGCICAEYGVRMI